MKRLTLTFLPIPTLSAFITHFFNRTELGLVLKDGIFLVGNQGRVKPTHGETTKKSNWM
jgi:hypothetical protein